MQRGVLVTGIGIVSSIGLNCRRFSESLKAARSGIAFSKRAVQEGAPPFICAELPEISLEEIFAAHKNLPDALIAKARECSSRAPSHIKSAIASTLEAWHGAMLHERGIPEERVGIVVAGSNLTENYQYGLLDKFRKAPEYLSPRFALHHLDTDYVGILSEILSIHGEGFTAGGASASGNVGIIKGLQLLNLGELDACLVVGAQADLSPMELQGYRNIGAYGGKRFSSEPEKACRPFDKDHEGFIYGQASGCLILETYESASRRGAVALAEIAGGSIALAGNRFSDPSEEAEIRVMREAIARSGIRAEDIDYINTHGTSSPLGDDVEISAIKKVFDNNLSNVWINSTKGLTGHCLYSAGIVEAIATIVQMREGFLHANANLDNTIDDECRFCSAEKTAASVETALSNSFGFGGINTSLVIKKGG